MAFIINRRCGEMVLTFYLLTIGKTKSITIIIKIATTT